jgi:hypothetical protein
MYCSSSLSAECMRSLHINNTAPLHCDYVAAWPPQGAGQATQTHSPQPTLRNNVHGPTGNPYPCPFYTLDTSLKDNTHLATCDKGPHLPPPK